ncbi:MAG: hypothetical protein O2913_05385 [Chloroflexi bacterium]|nr:hypothetical protein [Chloroflexota bacterium]
MTILRLRSLIFRTPDLKAPDSADAKKGLPKNWSARNWALVALFGILAIAGLEGYALSRGIDGDALRAALVSIGVLGGAGVGRVLK